MTLSKWNKAVTKGQILFYHSPYMRHLEQANSQKASRMVVAGGGEKGELLFNGWTVSNWDDERISEAGWQWCTQQWTNLIPLNSIL